MAQAFGQYAEIVAADYLVKKGFKILAQNFRYKRFEIDLIVKKDELIVFVEVKARKNNLFGHPEDFVNRKKCVPYAWLRHTTYVPKITNRPYVLIL